MGQQGLRFAETKGIEVYERLGWKMGTIAQFDLGGSVMKQEKPTQSILPKWHSIPRVEVTTFNTIQGHGP